jgi:nucleoside-diphosphate-sugar epimerase
MTNFSQKSLNIVIFGSGYLGFEISQKLKSEGHSVLIASRSNSIGVKKKNYLYKKYSDNIKNVLKDKDLVICANGPISEFSNNQKSQKIIKEYTKLIKKIFKESIKQKINKFIYLSSIHSLIKKNKVSDPKMYYYALSKKKIEIELIKISKNQKINLNILRLTNIFGYASKKNFVKSKSFINNFITQGKKTKKIIILSKENFKRIFFPINIFLKHIVFFVENDLRKKLLNIGDPIYCYSISEVAKKIKNIFALKNKINIKIYCDFSLKEKIYKKKNLKYFKNSKIKHDKLDFLKQLKKMI